MRIPTRTEAEHLLTEALDLNPGRWGAHSRNVAEAAWILAAHHPDLDADTAYVLGLLHDIGRRVGVVDMRHALDGFTYLNNLDYPDAARISLTHSFPMPQPWRPNETGNWDCTPEELEFVTRHLPTLIPNEYDRLIQLCDILALPEGFCLIEKRVVEASLRRGLHDHSLKMWGAYLDLLQHFNKKLGKPVYSLLPGVSVTTFGTPHAA